MENKKSVLGAGLLALLFGPIGVLYANKRIGLALIASAPVLVILSLMPWLHAPAWHMTVITVFSLLCVCTAIYETIDHNKQLS